VLGKGSLSKALNVTAHRFSKSAREKIEAAGGRAATVAAPVAGASNES
jgi:large subunit ribosomal protein L15